MLLLNESVVLIMRAKIETLLNAKSCQRGPGLAAIVINNLLGEDLGHPSPLATHAGLWQPAGGHEAGLEARKDLA